MNQTVESPSYRVAFTSAAAPETYEKTEYGTESYGSLLWRIEQRQLAGLINQMRHTHQRLEYLDSAAGTGRVLAFVAPLVDRASAVEISPAMAAVARKRVPSASIYLGDLTTWGSPDDEKYDLITLFRFVLNAESTLRIAALRNVARLLRDDSSLIVLNNHGNLFSHKLIGWPLTKMKVSRHFQQANYLTDAAMRELLADAGLEVVERLGCGLIGAKPAAFMPRAFVESTELHAAGSPLSALGVNQMYVARLARR